MMMGRQSDSMGQSAEASAASAAPSAAQPAAAAAFLGGGSSGGSAFMNTHNHIGGGGDGNSHGLGIGNTGAGTGTGTLASTTTTHRTTPTAGRILASPNDRDWLSPHLCVLRRSIEAFAATAGDVEARRRQGGATRNPLKVGYVGLRCVHCNHLPLRQRVKAAEAYPSSIKNVHQCVRNFQRNHFPTCPLISSDVRQAFDSVKSKHTQSKSNASEHWAKSCADLGMVDLPDGKGIVFVDGDGGCGGGVAAAAAAAAMTAVVVGSSSSLKGGAIAGTTGTEITGELIEGHQRRRTNTMPQLNLSRQRLMPEESSVVLTGRRRSNTSDTLDEALAIFSVQEEGRDDSALLQADAAANAAAAADDAGGGILNNTSAETNTVSSLTVAEVMAAIAVGGEGTTSADPAAEQLLSILVSIRGVIQSLLQRHEEMAVVASASSVTEDLHTLGVALHQTLAGENYAARTLSTSTSLRSKQGGGGDNSGGDGGGHGGERSRKRERRLGVGPGREGGVGEDSVPLLLLKDLGHPVSISIFCKCLIDATDEVAPERFTCLSEVDNDLQLLIARFDKYIFRNPSQAPQSSSAVPIWETNTIYGRQEQTNKLMGAFRSVVVTGEDSRGLALISGKSGAGKTSLVTVLFSPLRERRGKLIKVKFDNTDQSMLVIFRAFNQYCTELLEDPGLLAEVGASVKSALGSKEAKLLLNLMPALYSIIVGGIGVTASPLNLSNMERHNLLLHAFRTFVSSISAPSHPTVIFFDDLQWADTETLGLISALFSDNAMRSCLFVGCYRSDEVVNGHPLLDVLGQLVLSDAPVWQIFVENIGNDDINELLSDSLLLLPRLTAPFANEIYKKTQGSPLFVKQLVRSLCNEQLLFYSPSAGRWQWDIAAIRSLDIPDDAVGLVLERMSQYGLDVQRVLQIAALMGSRFNATSLALFEAGINSSGGDENVCGDGSAILAQIDLVVDDGLVCIDKAELRFAHDSIWEAALSLTPVTERERMHLLIGRSLLLGCSCPHPSVSFRPDESMEIQLQLIVDQMNKGSALIENHDEKMRLAELNLQAGKTVLATENFLLASIYFLSGTVLISNDDWSGNYNLCLDLFTSAAEAQLAHGQNEGAVLSANAVVLHGRCLEDTLASSFVALTGLYNMGKLQEALELSMGVLGGLGINLPSHETSQVSQNEIQSELQKTEAMLSSICVEDVASRPISTDTRKIFTMLFLLSLCKSAYVSRPDLMTMAILRMMQLILAPSEHTLTSESSFAFASYSGLLCTIGMRDRSTKFATIAQTLATTKFQGKYSGEVIVLLSVSIRPYRQPLQACCFDLETASIRCTRIGDLNTAFLCRAFAAAVMQLFASVGTLHDAKTKLELCLKELTAHGHPMFILPMVQLQGCLNLMRSNSDAAADPTILQGVMSSLPPSHAFFGRLKRKVEFMRLFLGYLFRRNDVVFSMAPNVKENRIPRATFYPQAELLLETFYCGLAAYSIVRHGDGSDGGRSSSGENWRAIGDDATTQMKALSENDSKWNFEQKFLLLQAERAFTNGNVEEAASGYDRAIESAKEHRFIIDQALSCERAALFYLEYGNNGQARKYLEKSRDLYQAWGAHRKVEDVCSLLATIQ